MLLTRGGDFTGVDGGVVVEQFALGGDTFTARPCHLPWTHIGLEKEGRLVGVVDGEEIGVGCWAPWCRCQCARAKAWRRRLVQGVGLALRLGFL